jgi:hypothetical protein
VITVANYTVAVEWHNMDDSDITELYGSFGRESVAQAEADRINKALEKVNVPWELIGSRSVRASVMRLRPVRIRPLVEEARRFLEPDDKEPDDLAYGQYSIDHSGSGS